MNATALGEALLRRTPALTLARRARHRDPGSAPPSGRPELGGPPLQREDGRRIATPAAGLRLAENSAARLTLERGGHTGWCGPAAIALAAGCGYAEACALLHRVAPERYVHQPEIVTAYWRDVRAALQLAGQPSLPLPLDTPGGRGPTLLSLARNGGLVPGLYLVRVTGHFLLLTLHGFGLAQVHDNRLSGAVLSVRTHGRCRVTHLARLPFGLV